METSLSNDNFWSGVTWVCLKSLGYFPCSNDALTIEMMGVIRMSG